MQIDDLRRELNTLSDEVEPFTGDIGAVHTRQRRRRTKTAAVAVALVAAGSVAVVGVVNDGGGGRRVHVSAGGKEVPPAEITHIDAIVVPATPAVKSALDASPLVGTYAFVPHRDRSSDSLFITPGAWLCALQTADGYAVDAAVPGADIRSDLSKALDGQATVYDVAEQFHSDFEIFLKVDASADVAPAMQAELRADPDIRSFQFLTTDDAYAIFKRDFADNPSLVQSTKPSDLPESFRVMLQPNRSISRVVARYSAAPGVDTVITPAVPGLWGTSNPSADAVSPCTRR